MVLKGCILRGVEDLQQRGGRVAVKTRAELVDFIEHEDGIATAGLSDALNNIARKCANIGTPMASNIRLVVDSTQTLAHELAIHRPSDALPERSLAHSRGTHQAQNRAFPFRHELTNREKFNNALFHFLEAVMVSVENFTRLWKIDLFFGKNAPREFRQPVQISPDHRVFRRHLRNTLKPRQLL